MYPKMAMCMSCSQFTHSSMSSQVLDLVPEREGGYIFDLNVPTSYAMFTPKTSNPRMSGLYQANPPNMSNQAL